MWELWVGSPGGGFREADPTKATQRGISAELFLSLRGACGTSVGRFTLVSAVAFAGVYS